MIGRTFGNFRIIEQIGMGGMATVYKAYDPDTDRYVAVKILPEHFSQDPKFRQRFEREARAIAKLEHLHILPLFTYGEDNGTAYMVMRYLQAGSLTDRIKKGALPLAEASRLLSQIASALDHAHANGVLHRDVKPSNVLLDADGNAFLTDFGIAKMVESTLDLTGGGILGTPAYMSPEQCRGNTELTPASDQYSLGIILYEMVTGRAPFQAETPIALIHMQLSDPLPLPRQLRPDLPEAAEQVILKALTKDPALRYPNCNAMAAAFARAAAQPLAAAQSPAAAPVVEDATLAAESPIDVTSPEVESATVLHGTGEPAAVPAKPRRRMPGWAWAAIGVVVLALLAGAAFLSLSLLGDETGFSEAPAEAVSGAVIGEDAPDERDRSGEPAVPAGSAISGEDSSEQEVRPCEWDGLGAGLCIYEPPRRQPAGKILTDTDLEIIGHTTWSPDGRQIAFSALEPGGDPDSETTIYIVNADGTGLTQLPRISNDINPAWSPSGEWLAFHSGCDLALIHPDGSDPEIIWEREEGWCVESAQWAPDSRRLVFSQVKFQNEDMDYPLEREVWVLSEEDSFPLVTIVHEDAECYNTIVAFSPDGSQVAYIDNRCQAHLVNIAGGRGTGIRDFPYHWTGMTTPQWGKDKAPAVVGGDAPEPELAQFPQKARFVEHCDNADPPQLCLRNPETEEVFKLTDDLTFESIYGMAWSPDGKQVVFDAGYEDEEHDLYLINADGSNLTQLTGNLEISDVIPVWSPNKKWIAFHRNCGLWLIHPDGSEATMLREGAENFCVSAIGWAEDGERLAFLNTTDNPAQPDEVWVINEDGSDARVIFELEPDMDPWIVAWNPRGDQIAFLYGIGDQGYTLLLDSTGKHDPKPMDDREYDKMQVWTWLPDHWPQWGDLREKPPAGKE